jgi:hypothetical protein
MIVFRKKYDDKKAELEAETEKEKKRGQESIKPARARRGHRARRR